ncbi:MAG: hypothetical protein NC393_12195 [Clostridium sp.]|nr:hypothetical protein [Clostridium sp.]MCM1172868.1 hypothetical protein [Clostridium sp.]
MAEKVLLTTMSLLNGKFISYYEYNDEEYKKYYTGVSQLEAGTKYAIDKFSINKIVVVGSEETIKDDDVKSFESIHDIKDINDREDIKNREVLDKGEIVASPYMFYLNQILNYINGNEYITEEIARGSITKERIVEIKELINKLIDDTLDTTKYFTEENYEKVADEIKENIRESFDVDGTELEDECVNQCLEKIEKYLNNMDDSVDEIRNIIKEFNDYDKKNIAEYYIFIMGINKFLASKSVEETRKNVTDFSERYRAVKAERDKLERELEALKSQRENNELNYAKYYLYTIKEDDENNKKEDNKNIKIQFVDEKINGAYNFKAIIDAIVGDANDETELYIDVQGGIRTSSYVRNAVIQIVEKQEAYKVTVKEIFGTNFAPKNFLNSIVDETKQYKISDLVSGMNAFIKYGKADMIADYCETMGYSGKSKIGILVEKMQAFDNALTICDVDGIVNVIGEIDKFFKDENGTDEGQNIYLILKTGIEKDYASIFENGKNGEISIPNLIEWCANKGFIQQALTLIESKMPGYIVKKGWLKAKLYNDTTNISDNWFSQDSGEWEINKDGKLYQVIESLKKAINKKKCLEDVFVEEYMLKLWFHNNCDKYFSDDNNCDKYFSDDNDSLSIDNADYYEIKQKYDRQRKRDLMRDNGEGITYHLESQNNSSDWYVYLTFLSSKQLDEVLVMHKILKSERNSVNHAAESQKDRDGKTSERTGVDKLKRAIKRYVQLVKSVEMGSDDSGSTACSVSKEPSAL